MAGKAMCGGNKLKIMWNGNKIKKGLWAENVIYSSGNIVTYHVDDEVSYLEEVDSEDSCLSPKMFIPAKSGWEFVGWREDTAANGTVLSSKVMTDSPIVLYAVFLQTITLSYNGNGATSGSTAAQTGTRYYNNGNVANPAYTLRTNGYGRSCYSFSKWALGSAGGTQYAAGSSITTSANTTMYAVWTYVGAPFYIAQGMTCKKALTWKVTDFSNGNNTSYGIAGNWAVGDRARLSSPYSDSTKNSYFTAVSGTIDTAGNHNMLMTVETGSSSGNAGCKITVNGQTKSVPGGSTGTDITFDISNVSSISITITCNAYAYGSPSAQFYTIYLY